MRYNKGKKYSIVELLFIVGITVFLTHYYGYVLDPLFVAGEQNQDFLVWLFLGFGLIVLSVIIVVLSWERIVKKLGRFKRKKKEA